MATVITYFIPVRYIILLWGKITAVLLTNNEKSFKSVKPMNKLSKFIENIEVLSYQ